MLVGGGAVLQPSSEKEVMSRSTETLAPFSTTPQWRRNCGLGPRDRQQ